MVIQNNVNKGGAIENIVAGFNYLNPRNEDVCMIIDGDDWLLKNNALEKVVNIYKSQDVNVTYGHYETYPEGKKNLAIELPKWVKDLNLYRCVYPFFLTHLKTFKGEVWNKLNIKWLKDNNDQFFKSATDVALMLSLVELAKGKVMCVEDALYCYNRSRNEHVDLLRPKDQMQSMKEIRSKSTACEQQLSEDQRWDMLTSDQFQELLDIEVEVMKSIDEVGNSFIKDSFDYKKHSEIFKRKIARVKN